MALVWRGDLLFQSLLKPLGGGPGWVGRWRSQRCKPVGLCEPGGFAPNLGDFASWLQCGLAQGSHYTPGIPALPKRGTFCAATSRNVLVLVSSTASPHGSALCFTTAFLRALGNPSLVPPPHRTSRLSFTAGSPNLHQRRAADPQTPPCPSPLGEHPPGTLPCILQPTRRGESVSYL